VKWWTHTLTVLRQVASIPAAVLNEAVGRDLRLQRLVEDPDADFSAQNIVLRELVRLNVITPKVYFWANVHRLEDALLNRFIVDEFYSRRREETRAEWHNRVVRAAGVDPAFIPSAKALHLITELESQGEPLEMALVMPPEYGRQVEEANVVRLSPSPNPLEIQRAVFSVRFPWYFAFEKKRHFELPSYATVIDPFLRQKRPGDVWGKPAVGYRRIALLRGAFLAEIQWPDYYQGKVQEVLERSESLAELKTNLIDLALMAGEFDVQHPGEERWYQKPVDFDWLKQFVDWDGLPKFGGDKPERTSLPARWPSEGTDQVLSWNEDDVLYGPADGVSTRKNYMTTSRERLPMLPRTR